MYPRQSRGAIRPKVSTMPRQHSPANAHLEVYKLTVEKSRLLQELKSLETRKRQIEQRVRQIDQQTERILNAEPTAGDADPATLAAESRRATTKPRLRARPDAAAEPPTVAYESIDIEY